jgi:hypothetical protein
MSVVKKNPVATAEAVGAQAVPMKAIVQERFGPPDSLQLLDAEKPDIGSGDVLLKGTPPRSTPKTGTCSAATRASPASWA